LIRPVADIPYITNVWMCSTTSGPLSEVSQLGEWESRETRYREVLKRAACILTRNPSG